MSITVVEKPKSGSAGGGQSNTAKREYWARGSNVRADVLAAVLAVAPSTDNGAPLSSYSIEPSDDNLDTSWDATINYSERSFGGGPLPETPTFTFDTTGGTQHISQSKETIARYAPAGSTAPDFKGAINVTKDGVEGVDITVPVYKWSETYYFADADVTNTFKGIVYGCTGTSNNATFRGFAIGEVQFLGATGQKRGNQSGQGWDITFNFSASPNLTSQTIGDITGIAKKGTEYLWVQYAEVNDTTANAIVKRPKSVHVERTAGASDFTTMGI